VLVLASTTLRGADMSDDLIGKTKKTAALYFEGVQGERPFDLWKSFDKDLAKDLSLFITGTMLTFSCRSYEFL
jgi:hypothetical protein